MKIEIDKPMIPKIVADWIESFYDEGGSKYDAIGSIFVYSSKYDKAVHDWYVNNKDDFITAVMYGYEIEQDPRYYAKNKLTGQYLGNKDIGVGYGVSKPYWVSNKLCFQVEKLPKEMFKKVYGLDDTNTDFERVG